MDKYFLLTYTKKGYDGQWHSCHAWFRTEKELLAFTESETEIETDLALEILSCREIPLREQASGSDSEESRS